MLKPCNQSREELSREWVSELAEMTRVVINIFMVKAAKMLTMSIH